MAVVFLLICWVGMSYTLAWSLSWLYSNPLPRSMLKGYRAFLLAVIFLGPFAVFGAVGGEVDRLVQPVEQIRAGEWPGSGGAVWAGLLLAAAFAGTIVWPAATVARWLRRRPARVVSEKSRMLDIAGELGYLPYGHGKHAKLARLFGRDLYRVEVTECVWEVPELHPAHEGLTILHISDLHLCGTPDKEYYERILTHAMALGVPDLVALTGDVVDSDKHHRWILPLLARVQWGTAGLAILGNHDGLQDARRIRRRLTRLGFIDLGGRWQILTIRGEPLLVVGHEGPWFGPPPDLRTAPTGPLRLGLSHTPDNLPWAKRSGISVLLAGHNHGGQVRIPGIGSLFVPSRFYRRYDAGTFAEGPTLMHVTRGLAGQEPIRLFCPAQFTRITLVGRRQT